MATQAKTKRINVSEEEVAKFNELAHKWWDKTSEFKPLHDINPLRLNFIHEKINLKNKKVLDVGCGGGILSESMANLGADVTGIDMGEKVINIAKLHALQTKLDIDYQCTSLEAFTSKHKPIFICLQSLVLNIFLNYYHVARTIMKNLLNLLNSFLGVGSKI